METSGASNPPSKRNRVFTCRWVSLNVTCAPRLTPLQMETFTQPEDKYGEKKEAESVDERDLEANKGEIL